MTNEKTLPAGYTGQIVRIDLTAETVQAEPLGQRLTTRFFGGRGLGAALLFQAFQTLPADLDPFSPDNPLIIATSPTTGTRMPTSGRFHMNYKSPLTGAYGSTNAGGKWSVAFKKNRLDAMILTGAAQTPAVLVLDKGAVRFCSDEPWRDFDAVALRERLQDRFGKNTQVLTIGPGGWNRCRFASVMSDTGKALGRGGGGAVWGSKNLAAIVAIPDPSVKIAVARSDDFEAENESGAMYRVRLKLDLGKFTRREEMFGILASLGSLGLLGMVNHFGQLIHNNMQDTRHDDINVRKIDGEALLHHEENARPGEKRIRVKKSSCYNCPIVCKRETALLDGSGKILEKGEGPEFESVALMGANLSIYDLPVLVQANNLANRYGLDTISLGATLAAFFELYEKYPDVLRGDLEEFIREHGEPGFGKPELLLPLIDRVGKGQGIGRYLAEGSRRFCVRYGHAELSMSVKGMELPAYDPRTSFSQALCYEMNHRGGCHLEGGYTAPHAYCAGYAEWPADRIEGTALISKNAALKNTALDMMGVCAYGSFSLGLDEYADLVSGVTGRDVSSGDLKEMARRILTVERLFNLKCGLSQEDDWLPRRFFEQAIQTKTGRTVCHREGFRAMHREFYHSMGWDDQGRPTKESLKTLDIEDFQ